MENQLRIRVRIGDSEVEASYPQTEWHTNADSVIKVVKAMVEAIKKDKA